jgi:hypothetical protein
MSLLLLFSAVAAFPEGLVPSLARTAFAAERRTAAPVEERVVAAVETRVVRG